MGAARVATWSVRLGDPGISPNEDDLPALPVVRSIVGALLTWGLVACLANGSPAGRRKGVSESS